MDPVVGEDTAAAGSTLSADELESWTLLDSSPRRSPNPVQTMDSKQKDHPSRVEDEEEEEDVSEAESASEEEEEEEANEADQEQEEKVEEVVSVKEKTSRVEVVQEKGPAARDTRQDDAVQKKKKKHRKKRTDSEPSVDSQDDDECSSDGISVISDSDGSETRVARARDQRKVHLAKGIRLEPVVTPVELDLKAQQLSRDDESKQLVREDAIVPWGSVNRTSVVVLGMFVTAIVAILVGNSRLHTNRVDEYSFQHEQRISELELENNILKNEMNKLKHLYTRSELEEQVLQADTEWAKVLDEKLAEEQEQAQPEPEPEPEPESPAEEPLVFRKVPPQDEDVKHKVVWSGDDGQPMLIADKDYVLPDFCFNKDAVQDDLFSEYSGKYCDIKKRKIEAKQRKAEFARKNHKRYRGEPKDYTKYIIPTKEEIDEYQRQATATPPKPPSLSPFDFDYQKAFETIKEEGSVIVDSLVAILDLDPEPEYLPTPSPSASSLESSSYQADDEASPSPTPSTESVPSGTIRWESFPPWVREKYESQPEMHAKLRHKESLLWDWERKKNEFLHQVGLETLEEVGRKSEDELRQRRDEYKSNGRQQAQSGEWRKEEHQYKERKHDGWKEEFRGKKYDERKGGKERYEERKEWNDRSRGSGENRSRDHKEQHHNQHHGKEQHQQQPWKNDSDKHHKKPEHHGESSKEWKNNEYRKDISREASGSGKPYNNNKKEEWKDSSREAKKHSGERDHKKDWKESGSGEQRKNHSGERRDGKPQNYKKDWKEGSGERDGKPYHKKHSGEHSGEHGKRKDQSGERKDDRWKQHEDDKQGGAKRNGDQWNQDHSGEDHSGEGSYLSQYRGEDQHQKKKEQEGWKHEGKRNYRDDDDDDDDEDDDHHKKHHGGKEDYQRKHHHKDDDHWKRKKHHDGDRKWQEHSQERRR